MTKTEAKKIEDAARAWAAYACKYGVGTLKYPHVAEREKEFLVLLKPMIDADDATKITYVAQCPVCHTKIEWDESRTQLTAQTPAEIAAENARCNAAYNAEKTK